MRSGICVDKGLFARAFLPYEHTMGFRADGGSFERDTTEVLATRVSARMGGIGLAGDPQATNPTAMKHLGGASRIIWSLGGFTMRGRLPGARPTPSPARSGVRLRLRCWAPVMESYGITNYANLRVQTGRNLDLCKSRGDGIVRKIDLRDAPRAKSLSESRPGQVTGGRTRTEKPPARRPQGHRL